MSEIIQWLAHFELEHEEYERIKTGGKVLLSTEDDTPDQKVNALLSVLS